MRPRPPFDTRTLRTPPPPVPLFLQIVTEPFLRNWIDTMCIFCGFPAKGAMTAHILYILDRFFEEGACYCVPIGGTEEIAHTLVRGLKKFGGTLQMNTHVDQARALSLGCMAQLTSTYKAE
eukprot:6213030-Pleurochrysis_carterae.AAC.2